MHQKDFWGLWWWIGQMMEWEWEWKELMLCMFSHSFTTWSTNCTLLNYYVCLIFHFFFCFFSFFFIFSSSSFSFLFAFFLYFFFSIHNMLLWNITMTSFFHFKQSNYATFLILTKQCNNIMWRAQMGSKKGIVFRVDVWDKRVWNESLYHITLHYMQQVLTKNANKF